MKKIFLILVFAMVTIISVDAHRNRHPHISITFQSFYDELSPYGDWIYTSDYGYVWRPFFDRPEAFRPYSSGGDWVYTEYGWTWVSDYRWGWAPFHYGRWFYDDYLGWMWMPGYEWAPAWVSWGSYGNYWGWAPLGPSINVNVNFNWMAPDIWWTFIPTRHFRSHHWRSHIYDRPVHVTNITYINNIYINDNDRDHQQWFRGPRVHDVERHTRTKVRQMEVVRSDRPDNVRVDNDRVTIYQPRVERRNDDFRPSESRSFENARSNSRVQKQDPRSNDPGVNRSRDAVRQEDSRNERSQGVGTRPSERSRESQRGVQQENKTYRTETKQRNTAGPDMRNDRQEQPAGNRSGVNRSQENKRSEGVGQQTRNGSRSESGVNQRSDVKPSGNHRNEVKSESGNKSQGRSSSAGTRIKNDSKSENKSRESGTRKSNSDRNNRK